MTRVIYDVVEHDGGFAYKVGDVFSETFPTHQAALDAAVAAADRQQQSGETEAIRYQTADGKWHDELASGQDRPETEVDDELVEPERGRRAAGNAAAVTADSTAPPKPVR